MALRKSLPVVAGLAALAVITPAFAMLPYTVSVNGDTSGTQYNVTAVSKGPVTLTTSSGVITCTNVMLDGAFNTGTVQNPTTPIAEFSGSTWTACTYAGSSSSGAVGISPSHTTGWEFNGDGDGSSSPLVDHHINGSIDGVSAHASLPGGVGTCQFDITGSIDAYLDESAGTASRQELTFPSTGADLLVSNVNSTLTCLGQVSNGDAVDVAGDFVLAFSTPFNVRET